MAKAIELGFQVAKPLGDSAQYDVIVDLGGRFVSVQIKSTYHGDSGATTGTYEASPLHACDPTDFTGRRTSIIWQFTAFRKTCGTLYR